MILLFLISTAVQVINVYLALGYNARNKMLTAEAGTGTYMYMYFTPGTEELR